VGSLVEAFFILSKNEVGLKAWGEQAQGSLDTEKLEGTSVESGWRNIREAIWEWTRKHLEGHWRVPAGRSRGGGWLRLSAALKKGGNRSREIEDQGTRGGQQGQNLEGEGIVGNRGKNHKKSGPSAKKKDNLGGGKKPEVAGGKKKGEV